MSNMLYIIFILITLFRLVVLYISKQNEKKLISIGAIEYGKATSKYLAVLHTAFYFSAFIEGIIKHVRLDLLSYIGLMIIAFSFVVLLFVIRSLNRYWTVKLIFEYNHQINNNWVFKTIKHPNYFLNIIPELIGVTLLFHAYWTFLLLSIPYIICLYLRIRQEDQLIAWYSERRNLD